MMGPCFYGVSVSFVVLQSSHLGREGLLGHCFETHLRNANINNLHKLQKPKLVRSGNTAKPRKFELRFFEILAYSE